MLGIYTPHSRGHTFFCSPCCLSFRPRKDSELARKKRVLPRHTAEYQVATYEGNIILFIKNLQKVVINSYFCTQLHILRILVLPHLGHLLRQISRFMSVSIVVAYASTSNIQYTLVPKRLPVFFANRNGPQGQHCCL